MLFKVEEGHKQIHSYAATWEELMTSNERIEANMGVGPERAHFITEGCLDQFAFTFFPPGLRWLGRRIPTSCRCHRR